NDVWALSLAGAPQWSRLTVSGPGPAARYLHTAIYDSVGDRMIVFGGRDSAAARNDVWALTLGAAPSWTQLQPGGAVPGARYGQSAVYDPVRNRMLMFGGSNGVDRNNEVWELALSGSTAWTRDTLFAGPTPRYL